MVNESELIEALEQFIDKKGKDDSLTSHLAFMNVQLEKIAKSLEVISDLYSREKEGDNKH